MTRLSHIWWNILEWAILGIAVAAFTITEQYRWYVTAGLLMLVAACGLRWARTRNLLPHTGLELPLLLFLGTAGLATWLAVERGNALLQLARMLAAWVLFYAVVQSDKRLRPWLFAGVVLLTLGLALYWPLQHDYSASPGKFPWITQLGVWINQHLAAIPGPSIHPNVAASTLAPGLAFSVALVAWAGQRRPWLAISACLSTTIIFAALLLTSSRGGWLAVAAAGLLAVLVLVQRKWLQGKIPRRVFWGSMALIAVLCLSIISLAGYWEPLLGQVPDPSGSVQGRLELWNQVLLLIGDAPFTGFGLMGFRMVYATYGILIHVPLQDHAHNTYLEVGLEQGLIGFFALLWGMVVILRWTWRAIESNHTVRWGWAGLAAIGVLTVHGIFDVVFYVTRPLPLIGLFLGMTWMLTETSTPDNLAIQPASRRLRRWLAPVIGMISASLMLLIFFRPLLAAWYANLGTIEQTRRELRTYDATHFDNPTLDEVRQQLDLNQAVSYFNRSLYWQPANRTATQHLAQISLSVGEYSQALKLMQAAWNAGHQDEITRLLLGDALVAHTDPLAAAEIVRGLPQATSRLNTQAWYRYYRQADYERAVSAFQAVLALDPDNTHALNGLQAIEQP